MGIYACIWSIYQLIFLILLLFVNPGYGELLLRGRKTYGEGTVREGEESICSICNSIVEMKVYHCDTCDLCCEGFSHHCDWVGKCIGYRNIVLLKGYFYGYVLGLLFMILIVAFFL